MTAANSFFIIFLVTILAVRAFLYFKPTPSPTILDMQLHHWMYGLVLMFIATVLANLWLYAIGLGLFVDELTFLLMRGKTHKDNYSTMSLVGTLCFILIVFVLRNYLILLFS